MSSACGFWRNCRYCEAILDRKVVALDREGRQDFSALITGKGNLHYAAFDALWAGGGSSRSSGAEETRQ
jgi:hypothetical protein